MWCRGGTKTEIGAGAEEVVQRWKRGGGAVVLVSGCRGSEFCRGSGGAEVLQRWNRGSAKCKGGVGAEVAQRWAEQRRRLC